MSTQVLALIAKAAKNGTTGSEALHYSQAALNAAQALQTLKVTDTHTRGSS